VRCSRDTVLDPSFGGGVFLRSASKRIRDLGDKPEEQVLGVELDTEVHMRVSELLHREFGIASRNLLHSDFFQLLPVQLTQVDVVVGNPPFIRYQHFNSDTRIRALARAREQGLR
jgi:adenine-specific DNA-methyltransferase